MTLADRLARVEERIGSAARAAGRDPAGIRLVVVTKFQPVPLLERLVDLGATELGESRHQEARQKAVELDGRGITWHFVGRLQSNKARQVARYASVLHSIDRSSLVDALDGIERPVDAFLQVDLDAAADAGCGAPSGGPGRGGAAPRDVVALAERMAASPGLNLVGVMGVAPRGEDPGAAFARLVSASERVASVEPAARAISAGMSADLERAVDAGATHLRVGTAIVGARPEASRDA